MTLYLKRDVSSDGRCFIVCDALGAEKYSVAMPSSGLMARHKLLVTDAAGMPAATIRRLALVSAAAYVLRLGKRHVTLVTLPTVNGMYTYFYGSNWRFVGDTAIKEFSIIDVDKTLILEHKRHADYCELTIPDAANELFCVTVSVCVNMINTTDSPALQAV